MKSGTLVVVNQDVTIDGVNWGGWVGAVVDALFVEPGRVLVHFSGLSGPEGETDAMAAVLIEDLEMANVQSWPDQKSSVDPVIL